MGDNTEPPAIKTYLIFGFLIIMSPIDDVYQDSKNILFLQNNTQVDFNCGWLIICILLCTCKR